MEYDINDIRFPEGLDRHGNWRTYPSNVFESKSEIDDYYYMWVENICNEFWTQYLRTYELCKEYNRGNAISLANFIFSRLNITKLSKKKNRDLLFQTLAYYQSLLSSNNPTLEEMYEKFSK